MTDPSETDELAALRARAFGRDADIHSDPEALQRLEQLEAAARPSPPHGEPVRIGDDAGESSSTDVGPSPESAGNGSADTAPVGADGAAPEPEPSSPWRTRLWIAGVAAAGVAGALIGSWATNHDPTVVAVLSPAVELGIPDSMAELPGSGDAIRFEDYLGVKIITYTFDDGSETPASNCIAVESESGEVSGGCAAKSLDAITHFDVREDASEALLAVHEAGTSLRLTHSGGRVEIRSSAM